MIKKYQLPNKLRVILVESKKSPVVTVQMWVRTGSADEARGEEGISHFIEHLLFKGTKSYGVGEIAGIIEAAGGELNAFTSFDQTVFHVTLSKQHIATGLNVIREMMESPRFDGGEIDNEREVVCEEIKRSLDSPHRESSRLMFANAFKRHPYGIPVIGYDKTVRSVSRQKIIKYFQTRYVPSNMTLLVAGDFDEKQLRTLIKRDYSRIKPFKLKKVNRKKEPKQSGSRVSTAQSEFQESFLNFAWKGPGPKHKDIAPLEVLGLILGQGESSRLVQAARIQKHVANSIGSGAYVLKDSSILIISSSLTDANLEELLQVILKEIKRLIVEGPTMDELKKAIVNFEAEEYFSLETVDGLARKIGHFEDLIRDPLYFKKFMGLVKKVTPADIVRVAKKYLVNEALNLTYLGRRNADESEKVLKDFTKEYKGELSKLKLKTPTKTASRIPKFIWKPTRGQAEAKRIELDNGVTILHRWSGDTPSLSVRVAALGGIRAESDQKRGSLELLTSAWTAGTSEHDETTIQKRVEGMAASLSAFGGRNSLGLSLDIIAPYEKNGSELFKEILSGPIFPEGVLNREKLALAEQLKAKRDNPAQVCIQQFYSTLFKGHPYAKDLSGETEDLPGITADDIRAIWKNCIVTSNLKVGISGHANIDHWIEQFGQIHLPKGNPFNKTFDLPELKTGVVAFNQMDKEQTHIVVGYRGLTLKDKDRYTLQVIQSILAGQGGRLFLELRDKNSLAYTVAPLRMEGLDTGYFGAYIACSPEKAEKAIQMLKDEFRRISEKPVETPELERSKNYIIGRHDIDLQRNSSIASSMVFDDLYDIDFREMYEFPNLIHKVTPGDVKRVAQRIFSQCEVISIAGRFRPDSI